MKTLKFLPHHVARILSGEKRMTWRLFDDKNLTVGDGLEFINKETGEKFCKARITKVIEKKLRDLSDIEREFFRGKDIDDLIAHYEKLYQRPVTRDAVIKVVYFQVER